MARESTGRQIGGESLLERLLLSLLGACYRWRFWRQWRTGGEYPHFEEQRIFMFDFVFARGPGFPGASPFYRGFWSAEMVRDGDLVLDLGCGDGFFSSRFLAERAGRVDAIDIDPEAIRTARAQNAGDKVFFHCQDAVSAPFPRSRYDVIVWDGALGHFSAAAADSMLRKITQFLSPTGVFVGSESLGREGADHLQVFDAPDDIGTLLRSYFTSVYLRELTYPLSWAGGFVRKEAYWRCSNDPERLERAGWRRMA